MVKYVVGLLILFILGFSSFAYFNNDFRDEIKKNIKPLQKFIDKSRITIANLPPLNPSNARIISIPDEVYQHTKNNDFFYDILHTDKRYVYVMYSKNSEYSQKFLKTISNSLNEKPLKKYYTLKAQAIEDRQEPQVEKDCKTLDECQEKIKTFNYIGNVWFVENCGSFCIIDNHSKRVLTPDISTESKEAGNREKALNFLNDTIRHK